MLLLENLNPEPLAAVTLPNQSALIRAGARSGRCLGANGRQIFFHVTLPATLPFILTGMRLAMGNSFATVVAAEMIAADQGIGFLIFNSRLWMATDIIFLAIVLLGVLGFTTDRIFRIMIRRFARQYGPIE